MVFTYALGTNGTVIPEDIRAVTYTVEGDAELVGDNPRKAEAGISSILLMVGKTSGMVKIKASAEGLILGEIEIKTLN